MPRPLVVGNGQLLVNFDDGLNMRDLYYPHVGLLNHVGGHRSAFGVFVDGRFSWCDEPAWQRSLGYLPDTLVTDVRAVHPELGIALSIHDAVDDAENVYLKEVTVKNLAPVARTVLLFFNQDLSIDESDVGDTAVYDPRLHAVYHYKRNRYFLFNGRTPEGGIDQFSTGIKRFHHAEGTWRDAEDGHLHGNPIAQGSVDSVIGFRLHLPPGGQQTMHYWFAVGASYDEVVALNEKVLQSGPDRLIRKVAHYWRRWLAKAPPPPADLSPEVLDLYNRSLLIIRTHVNHNGAITAANDSDILHYNRDHYSYVWPRDGAYVADALSEAGYHRLAASFFEFCARVVTKDGYLRHKYNPDGSVGSSWHAFTNGKEEKLPIQEDETASVLFALWRFYRRDEDIEYIRRFYPVFIRPAARFLLSHYDPRHRLPKPSYDLWEERWGIFTYTAATVYGGLNAAAGFAELFCDNDLAQACRIRAQEIREGMLCHLYDSERGRFLRAVYPEGDRLRKDPTVDSSLFALFFYDVLPADDPRVIGTMAAVESRLRVRTDIGGLARYPADAYFQQTDDVNTVPGNPWIICTLWLALWKIVSASTAGMLREARKWIEWAADRSLASGVLPEQLHPYTGQPLSVAPLTWSHATFVYVVRRYARRYYELHSGQEGKA